MFWRQKSKAITRGGLSSLRSRLTFLRGSEARPQHSVLLYTSIFGAYDELREVPRQTVRHDARCYTDQDFRSGTWRIERREPAFASDPILSARQFKIAHPISGYETCVYLDGAFQILRSDFLEFMLSKLESHQFVLLAHPHRACAYDESEACLEFRKGEPGVIREQVTRYEVEGLPRKYGLWATGCFAFRNNEATYRFRQAWWNELRQTSNRDQISLPYVIWKTGVGSQIATTEEDVFDNRYIQWTGHRV